MKTFNLPDLGEGLPEAEIVSWHVEQGDQVKRDQPLVSVETAKAVVEVPSPYAGRILRLHAAGGDIVATGAPLVDFELEGEQPAEKGRAAAVEPPPRESLPTDTESAERGRDDSATVVGSMPTSDELLVETALAGGRRRRGRGRVKAAPATRVLAKRLSVDLTRVIPSGRNQLVTSSDVEAHARRKGPARPHREQPARARLSGEPERLHGPRRAMWQSMSRARDQVSPCTLFDDADIHAWRRGEDFTARIVRAIVAGCRGEPGLNAWFDGEAGTRQIHDRVDLALAVDTPDGLIVPVLRGVERKDAEELRDQLDRLKEATRSRSITPEDMQDFTITLSNFGMLGAGRYAAPVIVPPTVAIVGAGRLQHDVVAVIGGIEVHRRIPLSLTFDHRCVTGGEACRFLAAVITDLELAD